MRLEAESSKLLQLKSHFPLYQLLPEMHKALYKLFNYMLDFHEVIMLVIFYS